MAVISNNRTRQPRRNRCDRLHQSSLQIRVIDGAQSTRLVGAGALDVAGLLAAVADTLRGGLLGAVAGQVTDLTAVVALLTLGAVTAHVAKTTARVASGLASTTVAAAEAATATAVGAATVGAATLGAVAGNVTLLSALVALLTASATAGSTTSLGALTADVAGTTAAVAGLLGLGRSALATNVTLLAAVVAGWGTLGGALGSAVRVVAA